MNKAVKNKFVLILLAIAVFIPTVVAVVNYNQSKNGPVDTKSVVSVTVSDLNGNKYSYSKDTEEGMQAIDLFVAMITDSEDVGSLPEPLFDDPFYLVTMSNGITETSYQYYFDPASTDAYYMDQSGKAFKPKADAVASFMKTSIAASVYGDSKLPVLSVFGADSAVLPGSANWFYKNYEGEFMSLDCSSRITSEAAVYEVEGGLSMNFDTAPDYFHVTVTSAADSSVIFDDLYENISNLKFDGASQVNVEVSAKWYEDSQRGFYGEMEYLFGADISAPAAFYLGATEISNGEFVSVTGVNVKSPEKITFTSEPDIGYTPAFYQDGDNVYAFIPVKVENRPASDTTSDTYKFTFTYGSTVQEVNLKVSLRTYNALNDFTYTVDADTAALYSDATREAASSALASLFAAGSNVRYFGTGDFAKLFADNALNRSFGKNYRINGDTAFRQVGLEYKAGANENVIAAEAGQVVFAGSTDITGNIVIIEHGYGLKTLYCHMDSVSVTDGQMVAKGEAIGKCGSTGFTNTTGVYFGMYVGNVPVSVYPFWEDGDFKCIPFYSE